MSLRAHATPQSSCVLNAASEHGPERDYRDRHLFIQEALADFQESILAVNNDHSVSWESRRVNIDASNNLDFWMNYMVLNASHFHWEVMTGYLNMLRNALRDEIIVLGETDAPLLGFAVTEVPYDLGHIIAHFVCSGEFFDAVELWKNACIGKTKDGKIQNPLSARVRAKRLYAFETQHRELASTEGDDENLVPRLPLEIRAHLSGFYDAVSIDDLEAESEVLYGKH